MSYMKMAESPKQKTKTYLIPMNRHPESRTRSKLRLLRCNKINQAKSSLHCELTSSVVRLSRHDDGHIPNTLPVVFMKSASPVEPVSFVKRICEDAMDNTSLKRTRFVKRLTPMTLMGRASTEGLEDIAKKVLAPHFHQEPFQRRKVSHLRFMTFTYLFLF